MRSPGAPWLRREIERQFWKQIATGITSEKAAEAVGVSQLAGPPGSVIVAACPCFFQAPYLEGIFHSPSVKRSHFCEPKTLG